MNLKSFFFCCKKVFFIISWQKLFHKKKLVKTMKKINLLSCYKMLTFIFTLYISITTKKRFFLIINIIETKLHARNGSMIMREITRLMPITMGSKISTYYEYPLNLDLIVIRRYVNQNMLQFFFFFLF